MTGGDSSGDMVATSSENVSQEGGGNELQAGRWGITPSRGGRSYRQDGLAAYGQAQEAATPYKESQYRQIWFDKNVWNSPEVQGAKTREEWEAAINSIIDSQGEGLRRHYLYAHGNENDAELAKNNDVRYILDTMEGGTYPNVVMNANTDKRPQFTADPLDVMRVRGDAKINAFGVQPERYSGIHQGVDLYAQEKTPVLAVGPGEILETGDQGDKGYGKYVILKFDMDGQPHYALYAHLSVLPKAKDENDRPLKVSAGDVIGLTGTTGNAKGMTGDDQHLHFELATEPTFGGGLEHGRRDPMAFFRSKMKVE